MPYATPTDVSIQTTVEIIRLIQQLNAIQVSKVSTNQIDSIKKLTAVFKKPRPDKSSTPISSLRVPDKVNLAPSSRVPNKVAISPPLHGAVNTEDSSFQRTATHLQHPYPNRHNKRLPHQANSGVTMPSHWANAIIDPISGVSMEYRHLVKIPKHKVPRTTSFSNELGQLAQGVGNIIKGTIIIYFIYYAFIPKGCRSDITYGRIVVDYRPQKTEPNRTRLTVGVNLINYTGNVSTPTADTTTTKIVINSTISTPKAKYMVGDVNNFYLGTTMNRYEYLRLYVTIIP